MIKNRRGPNRRIQAPGIGRRCWLPAGRKLAKVWTIGSAAEVQPASGSVELLHLVYLVVVRPAACRSCMPELHIISIIYTTWLLSYQCCILRDGFMTVLLICERKKTG
ncbi:hypothetical protein EVAR_5026_1 [Eumeta japonica]|uniref:Uncharacterized protein n=1 Tax=Eumeta variegata TaxID=151549 RepID=A0A4C1SWP7_EUMVA|nr:hypothetical protein EVAR_5026_1 [Eumeta japonica]